GLKRIVVRPVPAGIVGENFIELLGNLGTLSCRSEPPRRGPELLRFFDARLCSGSNGAEERLNVVGKRNPAEPGRRDAHEPTDELGPRERELEELVRADGMPDEHGTLDPVALAKERDVVAVPVRRVGDVGFSKPSRIPSDHAK